MLFVKPIHSTFYRAGYPTLDAWNSLRVQQLYTPADDKLPAIILTPPTPCCEYHAIYPHDNMAATSPHRTAYLESIARLTVWGVDLTTVPVERWYCLLKYFHLLCGERLDIVDTKDNMFTRYYNEWTDRQIQCWRELQERYENLDAEIKLLVARHGDQLDEMDEMFALGEEMFDQEIGYKPEEWKHLGHSGGIRWEEIGSRAGRASLGVGENVI